MKIIILSICFFVFIASGKSSSNTDREDDNGFRNQDIESLTDLKAYKDSSKVPIDCVTIYYLSESCSLEQLSFIGLDKSQSTISSILDRTLISKRWMGTRFEAFLKRNKDNTRLINMFKSVTAVVLSDGLSSSYYKNSTGAIYISAEYLTLNQQEEDSIEEVVDSRGTRSQKFLFSYGSFYLQGSKYITTYTFDEEVKDLALTRLLYHELAHANTYFPQHRLDLLEGSNLSIYEARILTTLEPEVEDMYLDLKSSKIKAYRQYVSYQKGSLKELKKLTAQDIIDDFEKDVATTFYGYTSSRENLAMAVEQIMMLELHKSHRVTFVKDILDERNIGKKYWDKTVLWAHKARVLEAEQLDYALDLYMLIFPRQNRQELKSRLKKRFKPQIIKDVTVSKLID